jgi:hypothetical protein
MDKTAQRIFEALYTAHDWAMTSGWTFKEINIHPKYIHIFATAYPEIVWHDTADGTGKFWDIPYIANTAINGIKIILK